MICAAIILFGCKKEDPKPETIIVDEYRDVKIEACCSVNPDSVFIAIQGTPKKAVDYLNKTNTIKIKTAVMVYCRTATSIDIIVDGKHNYFNNNAELLIE